jgi:hypothetical protein
MVNRLSFLLLAFLVAFPSPAAQAQNNILFVGNSFTYATGYNSSNVTDINGTGMGGVPGLFQRMASTLGYACTVSMEAVGGQNFDYHYTQKSALIGQAKWDQVILQDYSTEPTTSGDVALYLSALGQLKTLIRNANPNAKIFLYETWARADLCSLGGSTTFPDLATMLNQLHTNYFNGNTVYNLNGVAPVGDAFMLAITSGYADANPYNGIDAGKFNIWDTDSYHESKYGAYLAAAVFIERITGLDPRTLPTGNGSAAKGLNLSATDAVHLHEVAYQTTSVAPTITNGPAPASGQVGVSYTFTYQAEALPAAITVSLVSGSLPPGLTLTTAGVLSGSPTRAGIYKGAIRVSNGFGSVATQAFSISISGNYTQWIDTYFPGAGANINGPLATPQSDGVNNLLKYFFNIAPDHVLTAADRAALPAAAVTNEGTPYLTLTYRQNTTATGLNVQIQTSPDLTTWTPVTPAFTQTLGTDPVTFDPLIQVGVPTEGASRKFIRMMISKP